MFYPKLSDITPRRGEPWTTESWYKPDIERKEPIPIIKGRYHAEVSFVADHLCAMDCKYMRNWRSNCG